MRQIRNTWAPFRKVVIFVTGSILLLAGFAMIVLPGPALIVIPAALALLAIEFAWARRLLKSSKEWLTRAGERMRKAVHCREPEAPETSETVKTRPDEEPEER
ncbi:MAG TPA: PGPGW domain-containing protein [Planctomycetota bacterium]|jgi:hypothetical protein